MTETKEPTPLTYAGRELNQIDRHDLATVALRLVAIYLLVQGLELVPMLAMFLYTGMSFPAPGSFYLIISGGIYIGGGVLLMVFAPLGGRLLLPPGKSIESRPTGSDLQAVAFSVVGVVLAARAVGGITIVYVGGQGAWQIYGKEGWLAYLGPMVQLALGIALFLGARSLSAFWHKLRSTSYARENP
jgi:hypothetical protein